MKSKGKMMVRVETLSGVRNKRWRIKVQIKSWQSYIGFKEAAGLHGMKKKGEYKAQNPRYHEAHLNPEIVG